MAHYMNFEYVMFNQCAINNQSVVHVTYPPSNLILALVLLWEMMIPLGDRGTMGLEAAVAYW